MKMHDQYILGIDTSNYKTSIAVTDRRRSVIYDDRRFLKVKQGERGLRQSDALFQHIKNLPEMMEALRKSFQGTFDAVAYSARPRPYKDSYMPVFLAGESYGRTLAAAMRIPIAGFSHQEGHIEAIKAFSSLNEDHAFLACHFSGGTSELLQVTEKDPQKTGYEIAVIGGSKDIAFGQVLDRAGVALGMAFPSGAEMDKIALETGRASAVLTPVKVKDAWLNLSGIDTQIKNLLCDTNECDPLIREIFDKITCAMEKMILQGAEKTGIGKVLMAGGVASSQYVRKRLPARLKNAGITAVFGRNDLSQDNAVGTALLGGKELWR